MFKNLKIKFELKKFKEFKQNYVYTSKELVEKDGELYLNSEKVVDKDGKKTGIGEGFIDVGYILKGSFSKLLSNLFPYSFVFKGKKVASIESIFQGIKFKDEKIQNLVFKYSGKDAYHLKFASDYNWRETGFLFWQGKKINRFSKEYVDFVDENIFQQSKIHFTDKQSSIVQISI